VPEGVHLRDCPAAGLDVYEESLHGSVRVVDRQVEVQLSKKNHIFASVADPGCLSRTRIPDFGSRISDTKTATKERGEKKFFCHTFFCSQIFHKIVN
jgi:hypothetical protein